jgi:hypothetical protein
MEGEQLQPLDAHRQGLGVEARHELADDQEYDDPMQGLGHGTETIGGVAQGNNGGVLPVRKLSAQCY